MKKYIFAAMASAVLYSCGAVSTQNQPVLANTQWQLSDQVKGNQPTLVFENTRVSGNGGCNNYFGDLQADPATGGFSVKGIGATKKMCENIAGETTYFNMLPKANRYRISGSTLELYQNDLLLLKFSKIK